VTDLQVELKAFFLGLIQKPSEKSSIIYSIASSTGDLLIVLKYFSLHIFFALFLIPHQFHREFSICISNNVRFKKPCWIAFWHVCRVANQCARVLLSTVGGSCNMSNRSVIGGRDCDSVLGAPDQTLVFTCIRKYRRSLSVQHGNPTLETVWERRCLILDFRLALSPPFAYAAHEWDRQSHPRRERLVHPLKMLFHSILSELTDSIVMNCFWKGWIPVVTLKRRKPRQC